MSEPERKEIENTLQNAYDEIQKHPNQLPERLYAALEGFSSVLLAYKESKGKSGWSQRLVDLKGKRLFSKEQSRLLEQSIQNIQPELNHFLISSQSGGGDAIFDPASFSDLGPSSMFQKLGKDGSPESSFFENISLDSMYYGLQDKIKAYNDQWKEISDSLGIVKGIESRDVRGFLPFSPPIPYIIPGRAVLPILNAMLDMLRILFTNVFDIPTARVVLSLSLTFLDLLRGDWQNALLSLLGAVSKRGVLIGFFGKLIHNAWYLIAPDIRRQLSDSLYRSGKSAFVGFFLWAFTTFSPKFILDAVQNALDKVKEVIGKFNEQSAAVEEKAKQAAEQAGVEVEFPKIPLSIVPSLEDIQNLQVLARVPEIYCSKEVQDILRPLFVVPPLRLVLELLNIPTVPDQIDAQCSSIEEKSLKEIAEDSIVPKVISKDEDPGDLLDQVQGMIPGDLLEKTKDLAPEDLLDKTKNIPSMDFLKKLKGGKRKTKKRKQPTQRSSSISMPTRR
jgi:hypothetical protein